VRANGVNSENEKDIKKRQGGGLAIGVERSLTYRDLSDIIPATFSEPETLLVQIVHECFEIYLLNVYINQYARKKKYLKPLCRWLAEQISRKSNALWLVCGDFNSND
jgi:hypothetical protein